MILVNRLETFASQKGYFSQMQFEFQVGVGCVDASFTILETINQMHERVLVKYLGVFVTFATLLTLFELDLLFKLFPELGIEGGRWLAIKDLYTGVKTKVLYSGSLSRSFDVSQATG